MSKRQYRTTSTPGVYVLHAPGCPAEHRDGPTCRCKARWKGRRRNTITRKPEWQSPAVRTRAEVVTWLDAVRHADAVNERAAQGKTFGQLGREWLDGVESGTIQRRRRGQPKPYSATTIAPYQRDFDTALVEFHDRLAKEISEEEWQDFFDEIRQNGLSYSRAAGIKAVAANVYEYAAYRTRNRSTGVKTNPLRHIDLGANTGTRRDRVAYVDEAQRLLAALDVRDQVPYGIAFYAGLRRLDIHRLDWADVDLQDGKPGYWLHVRPMEKGGPGKVGEGRHLPIAEPLRAILLAAWMRRGRPSTGRVCEVAVMSGKLQKRAKEAWSAAGLRPIGLHECRHTYCSFLIAANVDLARIMRYMGHTQLSTTQRYIHVIESHLPKADEAAALNAYFAAREAQSG